MNLDAQELIRRAIDARRHAYAPYSQFKVGCALLGQDGVIYHGCNVENAAYGPTNCAERTALFRAIADGNKPLTFQAIAIVGDTKKPLSPCGVCRQVMIELCPPQMPVLMGTLAGDYIETTVAALLPGAFNQEVLKGNE